MAKKILKEKPLQLDDMQGLLAWGHGQLPHACYVLMGYGANADVRGWLFDFKSNITPASEYPKTVAINLAFTHAGLHQFDLDEATLNSFPREFIDGMTTPHRQRILGDEGENAPTTWEWGGKDPTDIHAVLFIYALTPDLLEAEYDKAVASFNTHGIHVIKRLDTAAMAKHENFGFRDGISQPLVDGLKTRAVSGSTRIPIPVPAGEFFLGYKNAYGQDPVSPRVTPADGKRMPKFKTRGNSDAGVDLGCNGSYVVFRQLEQDVPKFWRFMLAQAETTEGAIRLASKMVGRWPSGAPLVNAPERDNPALAEDNSFNYAAEDPDGMACPFGAHIRRANPRDALEETPVEKAEEIVSRHRILRRGRNYGPPLVASLNPHEMIAALQTGDALTEEKRGLMFICLNANIQRQFEFIQHTWCNNPKFETLYDEVDAISGVATCVGDTHFSVPALPVRQRVSNVPSFVRVRGGAYFFMPGMAALQFLASKRL